MDKSSAFTPPAGSIEPLVQLLPDPLLGERGVTGFGKVTGRRVPRATFVFLRGELAGRSKVCSALPAAQGSHLGFSGPGGEA